MTRVVFTKVFTSSLGLNHTLSDIMGQVPPAIMSEHLRIRALRYATVIGRWLLVAAVVFAGTMASGIYVTDHLLPKVYSATATLQVQPPPASSEVYSGWTFSSPQSRAIAAELESIESPEILLAVVTDFQLDRVWSDRVFGRSDPLTSEEAVRYLASHLRLNFKHGTNVVQVTALSDDPKEAAMIANAVVNRYKLSRESDAPLSGGEAPKPPPVDGWTVAGSPSGNVRVLSEAVAPTEPSRPNKRYCYAISAGVAGMLGVMVASALEVCLLIARAEAAAAELPPAR